MPVPTAYHRWLGWHAAAMRRTISVACVGLIVGVVLGQFASWELAVAGGWDASAIAFLVTVWPVIIRADDHQTQLIAAREDQTRGTATALLLAASVASLLGVGFALSIAGRESGTERVLLIAFAVVTVVLSWTLVNTVYTLRYAHLQLGTPADGIAFGDSGSSLPPTYRDFAYVAFTIGMTYQVSDTAVRDRRTRVTVLSHSLLSYVFGTVIVAGAINLIAGLVR